MDIQPTTPSTPPPEPESIPRENTPPPESASEATPEQAPVEADVATRVDLTA